MIGHGIGDWIASQVHKAGAVGAVIGLSGGIDSSVTAVLAKMGLHDEVLGLIMPCHSDPQDSIHANELAQAFDIQTRTIELSPVLDSFLAVLPLDGRVARANLKARLRMTTLYYHANLHNYLVVGTSNRSELEVGYFTKFGDGGADILPLAGMLKCQVRELARELEVPQPIIDKPPSGGLWPGQTDEGEMGITYSEIDEALCALETGEIHAVSLVALEKVKNMVNGSAHKRAMPPIFLLTES
jgi:NAD+ synthase